MHPKSVPGSILLMHSRRPFDIIAEGPSYLNWLHRVDEFRNCFLYENVFETNPQFQAVELAIATIFSKAMSSEWSGTLANRQRSAGLRPTRWAKWRSPSGSRFETARRKRAGKWRPASSSS